MCIRDRDKWWNFTLNHFLLLLNPKGWEEALQFIIPPVTGTIIFQGVAIRPAFQQLIKPAININSRQEFVTLLLIQSSGWLLWLALGYPFQGLFELGWDNWKSPWVGVMSCSLVLLDQGCPAGDFTHASSAWMSDSELLDLGYYDFNYVWLSYWQKFSKLNT